MNYSKIPTLFVAAAMATMPAYADDDDELPFDEARLFFELNDTDGDLGIHGKIDGDEWKYLEIEDPNDRKMLNIWVRGRLRRQGLTELFFESAEPTFDELDPEKFFRRFPEGVYDIEGYTLDWEERESEVYLSHIIPAAPEVVMVGDDMEGPDEDAGKECWDSGASSGDDVVITWEAVTESHFERWENDDEKIALGRAGLVEVLYYEFVVEVDETPWKASSIIPPGEGDTVSKTIPADFFDLTADDAEGEYKFEILVRTAVVDASNEVVEIVIDGELAPLPGNKSAVEDCFEYGS